MGFLFENLYNTSLVSSYDFYGVTMIIFIAMMGATVPANIFLEKHLKNANTRIFYSPVSRVSVYSSKILACFLFGMLCTEHKTGTKLQCPHVQASPQLDSSFLPHFFGKNLWQKF